MDIPSGTTILEIVPRCPLPDMGTDDLELVFWGAMLNDDMDLFRGAPSRMEWRVSQE